MVFRIFSIMLPQEPGSSSPSAQVYAEAHIGRQFPQMLGRRSHGRQSSAGLLDLLVGQGLGRLQTQKGRVGCLFLTGISPRTFSERLLLPDDIQHVIGNLETESQMLPETCQRPQFGRSE